MLHAIQAGIGLTFLFAAVGKLRHPLGVTESVPVLRGSALPLRWVSAVAFIATEFALATAHVLGYGLPIAVPVTLAVLVMFACLHALALATKAPAPCHCFGSGDGEAMSLASLVRVLLMFLAELWLARDVLRPDYAPSVPSLVSIAHGAGLAAVLVWVGMFEPLVALIRRHHCRSCGEAAARG